MSLKVYFTFASNVFSLTLNLPLYENLLFILSM